MVSQDDYEKIMNSEALKGQMSQSDAALRQNLLFQEQERGLAEEQLDVEEILDRLHNLFNGKEYKDVGNGIKEWVEPPDQSKKTLSAWGVRRLMQIARFHINKNTLLSNYDDLQINNCMYRVTTELNDLVLMKYKEMFREPTFEECKAILKKKIEEKVKLECLKFEFRGQVPDEAAIRKFIIQEYLNKGIDNEIAKIKDEQLRERIKEYGMICWELESAIYSTYRRAYQGKERETLRRHASFSEVRALSPEMNKKGGIWGLFGRG